MHSEGAVDDRRYAVTVGARLRAIRGQQRLSLQEVEARSREEFKASVLGAYERGERAISVARLQRLARFYSVPVDQLLPGDQGPRFGPRPGDSSPDEGIVRRRAGHPADPHRSHGAGHLDERAGRAARPVRAPHPGAARRLQRPGPDRAAIRPRSARLHPRRRARGDLGPARGPRRALRPHPLLGAPPTADFRSRPQPTPWGGARAVRPLPPRAVLRVPLRLLLVRDLDRPAPPDRGLPGGLPCRCRPAGRRRACPR